MSLTIAVLTGRRPALLARTLESFTAHHGDVWDSAARVVFHNTADPETAEILDRYNWHERDVHHGDLLTIGQASARLIALAGRTGAGVTLRLEDDWLAHPQPYWYEQAAGMLDDGCKQVRLRRADEQVSPRCLVCRKPMRWKEHPAGRVAACGHYTHNPSLTRTVDLVAIAGYSREREARRRFHPGRIGQLVPGVFSHLGVRAEGLSLKHTVGAG